jgi:Flp pilus assembly protein TadG
MKPGTFRRSELGASAAEFALVAPVLITITLGIINMCLMLWAQTALHYSVDAAARYCALNACTTTTPASTLSRYYLGPTISGVNYTVVPSGQTVSSVIGNCQLSGATASGVPGYLLKASGTYKFNAILVNFNVPIAATACFPSIT